MALGPSGRLVASLAVLVLSPAVHAAQVVKISVARDGVYRVADRQLAEAGARFLDADVDRLRLTLRGEEVPIRLEKARSNGPDGRFAFEFVGLFPRGVSTWEDPYTRVNLYLLDVADAGQRPARIADRSLPRAPRGSVGSGTSPQRVHFEVNRLLIRFSGSTRSDESWFWDEVKGTDAAPKAFGLEIADLDTSAPAMLRVRMMGHSSLPENPDHSVDVVFNGAPLGKAVWDGETPHLFEKEIPAGLLKEGRNVVALRAPGEATKGIDLVLLDWIEIVCGVKTRLDETGQRSFWADGTHPLALPASTLLLVVFDSTSPRAFRLPAASGVSIFRPADDWTMEFDRPVSVSGRARGLFYAVEAGRAFSPDRIEVSHPGALPAPGEGAEFLIVTHGKFRKSADRLAAFRRSQGLSTFVADVGEIYDRSNHGFLSPEAIRRFVAEARRTWSPAPRYLLLLGDASWDYKNDVVSDDDYADWHWQPGFGAPKNGSTPYRGRSDANNRQYVPTLQHQTPWGPAASDNAFATAGEPDAVPEIAVGRIPVATEEEAEAVVDKIVAYEALPSRSLGGALFVTNGEEGFVQQTEQVASEAGREGYSVQRVYPKAVGAARFASTDALKEGFDGGPAFLLFVGHGGRYVWHIGHENAGQPYDLFGFKHVDELKETDRLPVVVSLTCYSAPFDHPLADSIGEKLLRTPRRGAIAVVGASWRNVPPLELGRILFAKLGRPGNLRIGDAFLEAKRSVSSDRLTVAIYNLLGDPATLYRGRVAASLDEAAGPRRGLAPAGGN